MLRNKTLSLSARAGLVVLIAILLAPFSVARTGSAQGTSMYANGNNQRMAQYRAWMEDARRMYPYPQTGDKMWRVMMCESSANPNASGGGGAWLGLFQYAPTTWRGSWNPYRKNSIWDAKSQIYASAKAWSIGMQRHWSCYFYTAGR
jgi:hypothetical protein